MPLSDASLRELGQAMEVLGSEVRLRILRELREPSRVSEIRVETETSRAGEQAGRPLSRQAVSHHLDKLQAVGLVKPSPVGGDRRGDAYLLNHERLFALIDELRQLNRLRPFLEGGEDLSQTRTSMEPGEAALPRPPRLLEAYGATDGRGFPLPAASDAMIVGRDPESDVHLAHDPYISGRHCKLERGIERTWQLTDLGSKNGTWVNWMVVQPGDPRELKSGDLLRVGRTLLVFQA